MINQQETTFIGKLRQAARRLKAETWALFLAARDPRTPWYAKLWAGLVVAYAFSPIDLIPDFVPVLGYLDDVILVPAGIALAIKMIPIEVMQDSRAEAARQQSAGKPAYLWAAVIIVLIWLALAWVSIRWILSVIA